MTKYSFKNVEDLRDMIDAVEKKKLGHMVEAVICTQRLEYLYEMESLLSKMDRFKPGNFTILKSMVDED